MFFAYILQSEKTERYYIGATSDLEKRMSEHNRGRVRSTKHGLPWRLVYQEVRHSFKDARRREQEIKDYKGGIKFKKLLGLMPDDSRRGG